MLSTKGMGRGTVLLILLVKESFYVQLKYCMNRDKLYPKYWCPGRPVWMSETRTDQTGRCI